MSKQIPAIITSVHGEELVNVRALCDGTLTIWKTSIDKGDKPGQWNWPVIKPAAESKEVEEEK